MKKIKQILFIIILLLVVAIVFRGWFYQNIVSYQSIGERTLYMAVDERLIQYIEENNKSNPDVESIIKNSLRITSKKLTFSTEKTEHNPNKLIYSEKANCIGYSHFYSVVCNHLLNKNNLADTWVAKPQIGQLYFFGTNIHKYFKLSFFKDHDFVTIENKKTGKIFAVDPTINDYFWIDFVKYSNNKN